MSTEGQSQIASGVRNKIMLSLCLITSCLQAMTPKSAGHEQGDQILLCLNLALGFALAMASIFVPGEKVKEAAAKLSLVSAAVSLALVMTAAGEELFCKSPYAAQVQACRTASAA